MIMLLSSRNSLEGPLTLRQRIGMLTTLLITHSQDEVNLSIAKNGAFAQMNHI